MSFLSSLAKKVSDKAVEVLPDDRKEAVKQLSRGDLSGVKQVRTSASALQLQLQVTCQQCCQYKSACVALRSKAALTPKCLQE